MQPMHFALWVLYFLIVASVVFTPNTLQTNLPIDAAGFLLLVGGSWLMVWAKYWLGKQYERLPQGINEGHVLVMNGPYALVRHPEYVGIIIAFLGLSLALKSSFGVFVSFLAVLPVHVYLAYREELMLKAHFKERYTQYCDRVGVLPGIK